jgi:hypothetical protein
VLKYLCNSLIISNLAVTLIRKIMITNYYASIVSLIYSILSDGRFRSLKGCRKKFIAAALGCFSSLKGKKNFLRSKIRPSLIATAKSSKEAICTSKSYLLLCFTARRAKRLRENFTAQRTSKWTGLKW